MQAWLGILSVPRGTAYSRAMESLPCLRKSSLRASPSRDWTVRSCMTPSRRSWRWTAGEKWPAMVTVPGPRFLEGRGGGLSRQPPCCGGKPPPRKGPRAGSARRRHAPRCGPARPRPRSRALRPRRDPSSCRAAGPGSERPRREGRRERRGGRWQGQHRGGRRERRPRTGSAPACRPRERRWPGGRGRPGRPSRQRPRNRRPHGRPGWSCRCRPSGLTVRSCTLRPRLCGVYPGFGRLARAAVSATPPRSLRQPAGRRSQRALPDPPRASPVASTPSASRR